MWEEADELGVAQVRPTDLRRTIEHVRHDLEEELRTRRSYGRDPRDEALRYMLQAMDPPKVDWRGVLRRVSGSHMDEIRRGHDDYVLTRPNRRRMYDDSFILPSFVSYAPRILFAVDTSGSMGESDMRHVASEAQGVLRELGGRLECVAVDVQAKGKPRVFSSVQEMFESLRGGGGTDMSAALYLVDSLPAARHPDLLVIATDGFWSWRAFSNALRLPGVQGLHVIIVLTNKEFVSSSHGSENLSAVVSDLVTVVDAS